MSEPPPIAPQHLTVPANDLTPLAARARALARRRSRVIIGITGTPGAGKSTVTTQLAALLGPSAVVVPFDGFHLADDVLVAMGRRGRKGAVDTFDLGGYRSLVRRLRAQDEDVVYAPTFRREIEDPIASAIPVERAVSVIVTEGNYLLDPAAGLDGLLDEVWFLEVDEQVRLERLIERHVAFGKTHDDAVTWATGSDENNARLIRSYRERADLVVRLS